MIEASFLQEYRITLDREWLENNTPRRFMSLVKGLTKRSAVGQMIEAEHLQKNKDYKNLLGSKHKKKEMKFNVQTEEGILSFYNFANNMFGRKEK